MSQYRNLTGLSYQPPQFINKSKEKLQLNKNTFNSHWELYQDNNGEWGFIYKVENDPFDIDYKISYVELTDSIETLMSLIGEDVDINLINFFTITWYNGTQSPFTFET